MIISLIPDTAPFSPEQRAWLNGFLAGWTGLHSETGSVRNLLAPPLQAEDQSRQPEEEVLPWHDDSLTMDKRLELASGKPLKWRLMAAMAQLDCGACGYVCRTYSEALASGQEKSLTLCAPGGKATAQMLRKLFKEEGEASTAPSSKGLAASPKGQADATSALPDGYCRAKPVSAVLKETRNLNGPGSAKHTSHVVLDLGETGLCYRAGDALGVYPANCKELVEAILARVSFDRSNGACGKLRAALSKERDLSSVPEEFLEFLIASAADPAEKVALAELMEGDRADQIDVLDALQLATSARVEATRLLEQLGPMRPRLYSIASSQRAHPNEVHLTVARVTCELRGRQRKGVASTMFSDRLQPGDAVPVFIHATSDFTIPAESRASMIMVGPGTGIAPFRAFLEERRATGATGRNWLFFGDQHSATDFLYQSELEEMRRNGLLTRIDTAFSRDQEEKIYVQHRMLQNGARLFEWLEEGAYFFVCGDAQRMAVDVDLALHQVVTDHGRMSADQAANYVQMLKKKKRYVRDVY